MHSLNVNDAACAYLLKMPRPYQRAIALERCTSHLVKTQGVSQDTAALASIQAIAELESVNQAAYVDASSTTAHVVIVRRPGMTPMAFSVADLLRLHAQQKSQPTPPGGTQH